MASGNKSSQALKPCFFYIFSKFVVSNKNHEVKETNLCATNNIKLTYYLGKVYKS